MPGDKCVASGGGCACVGGREWKLAGWGSAISSKGSFNLVMTAMRKRKNMCVLPDLSAQTHVCAFELLAAMEISLRACV